jgi:type I restriction enzyme M protein
MKKLMGDQDHIRENLFSYIQAFSPAVRDIFERFESYAQIDRLAKAGLLYLVAERFAQIDLHPKKVSNSQMGLVFEELIRKFAEISNETAGEHFTPREVIRLMVNLLFIEDDDILAKPCIVRTIYEQLTPNQELQGLRHQWTDPVLLLEFFQRSAVVVLPLHRDSGEAER